MLTPSDIVAAKLLVQLGDVDASLAREHLRAVDTDGTAELDLVARLANASRLEQPQVKRIRQFVALFEHVRHEAVYLRQLERSRRVPKEDVSELIAQIELASYRRRLGAVLVDSRRISIDDAVSIERETRRILQDEDRGVVERYRAQDFEGVARPLIPAPVVDLSAFRVSVLFRSRETQARVSRALLRMRLEAAPPTDAAPPAHSDLDAEATQVYAIEPKADDESTVNAPSLSGMGSSRFRAKPSSPVELSRSQEEALEQPEFIGEFQVLEVLGRGGMGAVYLGREEGTGMMVAIKVMHSKLASPSDLARFDREAHITGLLRHEKVVQLIDRGMTEQALAYLVIPFYAGKTLRALLRESGPLDPALAFHIMEQILEGTQAIHDVNVVHRDLKPENIFLLAGLSPQVRVVDMGIARVLDDALPPQERQFRTISGVISGSPAYVAPETASGDPIVPQTDIYSLGVIFFQMLTGRLPLSAGTPYEFLREHLVGVPRSLTQAKPDAHWCPEIERLIAGMLAKEAIDRPDSCGAILSVIQSSLREKTLHTLTQPRPPAADARSPDNGGLFNQFFKMIGR